MSTLIIFFVVLMILAVLRIPLAYAILGAALVGIIESGSSFGIVASTAFSSIDVFAYLAIPGFIYAGDLMLHGKIAENLLGIFEKITTKFKSALGSFVVLFTMLFGTIIGSSAATVGLIASMFVPRLNKLGFKKEDSAALIAASGVIGILIPPSIPGIMYAIAANQSIIEVWSSTIMPAVLLAIVYIMVNIIKNRNIKMLQDTPDINSHIPGLKAKSFRTKSFVKPIPALLAPIIIFGGIFGGVFTPTEAGAMIALYSLVVGYFIYKGINNKNFFSITFESVKKTASIVILIAFASVAGRLFTIIQLPEVLTDFMQSITASPLVFLILVNILLIIIGMFMETNTSILILTPILLPVAMNYGIDPLHFGAVLLLNLELGMITPPFAVNLFVASKVAKVPFHKILKPIMGYFAAGLLVLVITTFIPEFSLFLVNLLN